MACVSSVPILCKGVLIQSPCTTHSYTDTHIHTPCPLGTSQNKRREKDHGYQCRGSYDAHVVLSSCGSSGEAPRKLLDTWLQIWTVIRQGKQKLHAPGFMGPSSVQNKGVTWLGCDSGAEC